MKERKETVRLNFEFPRTEYPFLKMLCAQRGVSFRELATELVMRAIEEYEEELLSQAAEERMAQWDPNETVSWDEAQKLAGWDHAQELSD